MKNQKNLLGGMSASAFLRDYWQKKPLLIRQACPPSSPFRRFSQQFSPQQLVSLACAEVAQARLVTQQRGKWQLHHAPFAAKQFASLGKSNWTVLVQGVNHILPQAADLLQHFNFIPTARLDDLMVSYAPKGGGVGPHFDSYDVFLLQGSGHRRWQISAQPDRTLIEGVPLKIIKDFKVEQEWVLAPGDMLYLPPHYAHNGVAEDDCMTYSIGFRAPSHQELAEQFLVYMQDRICLDGIYSDLGLKLQRHPAEISADMLAQVQHIIEKIQWNKRDIADFIGGYLSEPKPHIFFEPPTAPLTHSRFVQALRTNGVALMPTSQMLCHGNTVYINGAAHSVGKDAYQALRTLADTRQVTTELPLPPDALELLYQCYLDGYIMPVRNTR